MLMVTLLAAQLPTSVPNFPAPSANAVILLVIGLVLLYSLLAGYGALVRESISVYVGLVLAASFGKPLYDYASRSAGHNFPATQMEIQILLLVLPIVILQFAKLHIGHAGHHGHKHNPVVTLVLAILTALLMISSVLTQFDPLTLNRTIENSNLASWIYDLKLAWLGAVPLAIAASAIIKPRRHQ